MKQKVAFVLILVLLPTLVATGSDWPHWRGLNRSDVTSEDSGWKSGSWSKNGSMMSKKEVWGRSVGLGCTSPLVIGNRLYTFGWRADHDTVVCLDASSGREIWKQSYPCPKYGRQSTGDQGIYSGATATPEYDVQTKYLYTLSVDGHLQCWDTDNKGKRVWRLNLYDEYRVSRRPEVAERKRTLRDYGYTSSPLIHKNMLIVEVGDDDEASLMGFDKMTGNQIWTSQCKDPAGHSGGPVPITIGNVPCVAVLTIRGLLVVRLDKDKEGKTVAFYEWTTDFANNIATPTVHGNEIIITSAYNHYAMCKIKVTLDGATKVWEKSNPSGVCSPIIHNGHVYWAWRGVHCVDFATGKEKWRGGKVAAPGSCIVTSDNRLIVLSNRGDLSLVDTAVNSPGKYRELAIRTRLLSSDVWPHVVLSNGLVYCKDRKGELKCYAASPAAARRVGVPNVSKPSSPAPRSASRPASRSAPRPAPFKPIRVADLKSWPGTDVGLVVAWSSKGVSKVAGLAGNNSGKWSFTRRGSAKIAQSGVMELANGALLAPQAEKAILYACKQTGQLGIEAVITSSESRQTGPARIISFSSSGYLRNFTLAQEGEYLVLRLRTPRTGSNGMNPETRLCRISPKRRHHVIVTYRDGELVCYLDGKQKTQSTHVHGDFANWDPKQHFLFGDEWSREGGRDWKGQLERFAIHNRFIGAAEARRRYQLCLK